MKRFVALTLIVALMVITAGAVRTPAQNYYGYDVDADYGGDYDHTEPMWTINFYLDGVLMYGTYNEESMTEYVLNTVGGMMQGEYIKTDCFTSRQLINVYYTKGE